MTDQIEKNTKRDLTPITVTIKEVVQITGLGERTIRRRCDEGVFESFNDGKRFITYASVMAWMEDGLRGNLPKPASTDGGAQ